MFRFFSVKNDNSADGEKIIWNEEINILQPEVVAHLDELRNGKEIVLPLKLAAMEGKEKEKGSNESEGGTNVKEESDEDTKEEESLMNRIFSFFAQCLSKVFGDNSSEVATSNIKDPNEITSQNSIEFKPKLHEFENYSSDMPLLEEHQKELASIWSMLKPKSIVTGRRTMRRLSETANGVYTLKKIKLKRIIILIFLEQVYATLTQSTSKTPYTGYFLQSIERRNLTVYYTSEIDAHWNSQKFEIKALEDTGNHVPCYYTAYRTAIQCFYSDIKECIFGYYTDTHVTLKLFTYAQLVQIVTKHGWNINKPFNTFHTRADKIAKFIKENDHKMLNKTAKITTKNNEMVFEIQD
uniref:Uncharacterized protein n=1 Tax=Panagrolaimus davidi TaxID=227884 RepID=A0A914PXU2_9BILA